MPQHALLQKVRVWDLPVRVFHWLLVICFIVAWVTHNNSRFLHFHVFAGYTFAGLLLFRLLWGICGTHYARFTEFAYSPAAVIAYLRGLLTPQRQHFIGHNPAGSWAIYLLLLLGLGLSVSGVMTLGVEEQKGPLAGVMGFALGHTIKEVHELCGNLLLLLVGLHVTGVIIESYLHKENLLKAMITGDKPVSGHSPEVSASYPVALLILLLIVSATAVYFSGYREATEDQPYLPYTGPELTMNASWQEACGECHLAFHPSLLPQRSWQRLFDEQAEHFGEDLFLEPEQITGLLAYANTHAAEQGETEAAWLINRAIVPQQRPLRITETRYWKRKHDDFPEAVWQREDVLSRTNCGACHHDAEQATFQDGAMAIPGQRWWQAL